MQKTLIETPDIETPAVKIPDELMGLFGNPPLLDGEDPKFYWDLLAVVVDERKPKSFAEWVYVYDEVTKLWEEQRLRRASAGLLRGERFKALQYFLEEIGVDGHLKKTGGPTNLAFKYFSDDRKERQEVVSLLEKYGITPATVQAKAAQLNSDAIQMFEAMIARREKSRRKLRKDDDRARRRRDAKQGSGKD